MTASEPRSAVQNGTPKRARARWLNRFLSDRSTLTASIMVLALLAVAASAPWLAPFPVDHMDPQQILRPPSLAYPLGTDHLGRDVLSRILHGSRISVLVAVLSTIGAGSMGVVWGAAAAYAGGWIDEVSSRIFDILLTFPYIVLAMALVALLGPGTYNIILVIAIIRVPIFARLVRGAALTVKENEYMQAAVAIGVRPSMIVLKHLIPNLMGPVLILASLTMATAINTEAALSFLGLGVTPPQASWGTVLATGRDYIWQAAWISTFAGLAITLAVLSFNLLGDGLRDLLDPRAQTQRAGRR